MKWIILLCLLHPGFDANDEMKPANYTDALAVLADRNKGQQIIHFTTGLPLVGSPLIFLAMRKLVLFLLLLPNSARSQVTYFNIQFDYSGIWNASASILETDSFFIASGGYVSPSTLDTAYLLKINKNGETLSLWKADFFAGGKIFDITSTVSQNRIEIRGRMNSNGFDDIVNSDLYFAQLSLPFFDTIKVRTYGVPNYGDYSHSLTLKTMDNGFAVAGYRFSPNIPGQKLILLKCDSLLNQVFLKAYSKNNQDNHTGHGVIETPDKGFIVVGSRSFNTYDLQGTYLRVDSLGNLLWWKDIVPQGDEEFIIFDHIERLGDGTYLVVGRKSVFTLGFPQYMVHLILNINEEGDVLWTKEHGDHVYDDVWWRGLLPLTDGSFLAYGLDREHETFPGKRNYGSLAKLTLNGDILWERRYSVSTEGQLYDVFWKAIPTMDGGIVAVGSTWGDSITKENSWIIKLDSLGCLEPGCDSISTGVIELPVGKNSPVKIYPNPTGGDLTIEAQGVRLIEAVKIYDLNGRRLKDETFKPGRSSVSLDLSGEPAGGYFCTTLVNGVWITRQVVLK